MSTSTLCLHHNDADGRASAAIVRRALGQKILLHEMNYGDPIPWELISKVDRVVIVDFSLSRTEMTRIAQGNELIWIDHHISAIKDLSGVSENWQGIRDTGDAACVLTWRYFFPDQPVPHPIVLIGDRDTWHWREAETGPFDEGLHQENTNPENDSLWGPLLNNDPQFIGQLIARGKVLREASLTNIQRQVDNYGFAVNFEGLRAMAINARGNGDIGSYIQKLGYQLAYCYIDNCQNGNLMTFVGLYSSEVDVSEIAKKFGGGGHRGASGFSFQRSCSPFPEDASVNT